ITDANACQITRSFTITQPALLTASATPSASIICSGSTTDIALTSVPSGASFTWTVSSVSGNVSGASAGSGSIIEQILTGNGIINYVVSFTNGTCTGTPITIPVTINALTVITGEPENKFIDEYETTSFAVTADYAGSYQWQVNDGEGFVNVSNNEMYAGAQANELTITGATESMNGYLYRCIVSGNCSPATSTNATLNVKLRTPQYITFASTNQVIYGVDDFSPEAISDAGLEITYTSGDITIAEIINGKIHVKRAGDVTITASQAGNSDYKPATSVTQLLTISKKDITVTLNASPAITKTYDGNAGATLAASNYALNGAVGEDEVYVTGEAAYDDNKAGNDKHITVNNFILHGQQKNNYNLITASADVNGSISKKEISITLNSTPAITKTYNGNTAATLTAANYIISGIEGEDEVSVTGTATYEGKNAGANKNITVNNLVLQGNDKDNYELVTASAVTAGSITTKPITVTIAAQPVISKVYDGNTTATANAANYVLHDAEEDDDLSVSATVTYDNMNVGEDKVVAVSDFVLSGDDKNNYTLETTSAQTTGIVTKKMLVVTLNSYPAITKQYDGNTIATVSADNFSIEGIVGEDMIQLHAPETGVYDTKHGGINKKVTITGLTISGEDTDNYELASVKAAAEVGTITKKAITVSADPQTKVYGKADPVFAYTAEGKLEGDELPGSLGRAEGKHVGEYEINIGTLSGGDDYEIEDFNSATLVITPAPLVIKADSKTKKQGTANPSFTFTYDGLAEGDVAADLDTLPVASTNAVNASPIGTYDIKAKGAASHNYAISYEDGTLTVTPSGNEAYSMKVWTSSPDVIQVRIYSAVAQKATITLYTEVGQKVIIQQKQLIAGINTYSIYAGNLASSTYVLGVMAEKFKDAQKVKVK
ncbi:MAG: YDG domain-containing protein, partial [Agriterribacter sp.]